MAERAGARATVEIPGAFRALPASQPQAVADFILWAAAAAAAAARAPSRASTSTRRTDSTTATARRAVPNPE